MDNENPSRLSFLRRLESGDGGRRKSEITEASRPLKENGARTI